jgi:hypothetical protein
MVLCPQEVSQEPKTRSNIRQFNSVVLRGAYSHLSHLNGYPYLKKRVYGDAKLNGFGV